MTDSLLQLEERTAHLQCVVDDLSDIVARQEREITQLARRVDLLMQRAAEREEDTDNAPPADQPPPHW